MYGTENERPGIEEMYELATNTSDLSHEAERRTAADVLRDMAMSTDRLGAALRRLRGQWEAVEKPVRQRTRSVKEWLAVLPRHEEGRYPIRDEEGNTVFVTRQRAAEYANEQERLAHDQWHERELNRLAGHLADLPAVRDAVTIQAVKWGIQNAGEKAGAIVRYWLDQNCPVCKGTQWQTVAGTNRQGTKACRACAGSGVAPVPHGQDGRKLVNHMDQCQYRNTQTRAARRQALQAIPPIDRLSKRMQAGGPDPDAD